MALFVAGAGKDTDKAAIERLHGTLLIHSGLGVGTTFTIELPCPCHDDVDVSLIARAQGGGGHRRAAGFSTTLELEELIAFLRLEIAAQLHPAPAHA